MAVDPGQNVGMAFRFDNGAWGTLTVEKVPDGDERFDMVLGTILEMFEKHSPDVLIVESFKTMSRYVSKYGLETLELIGAIRALAYLREVPITQQMPNQRIFMEDEARSLLRDRRMRFTDHEVSALAHLLAYEFVRSPEYQKAVTGAGRSRRSA